MPPIVSVTINLDFLLFIFRSSYFLAYHHVKTVIFIDNRHIRYLVTECDGTIIRSFALAVSTIVPYRLKSGVILHILLTGTHKITILGCHVHVGRV